ncbi:hypothetical protein DAEQUDRAFT_324706 [Daedalea quercina L-15889]|uniref:Secreted protein n=1 Tax=Daedalea quercina L-15889 TaxID=1314783 RepID=A0A165PU53_9APHY|nr:hypothetical protein DAEQUDRAFT_324706 [Daedalea quercina L-15889]
MQNHMSCAISSLLVVARILRQCYVRYHNEVTMKHILYLASVCQAVPRKVSDVFTIHIINVMQLTQTMCIQSLSGNDTFP